MFKGREDLSKRQPSSLHWIISLSFCSFSYNGVCFEQLKHYVSDVTVGQKGMILPNFLWVRLVNNMNKKHGAKNCVWLGKKM